MPDEQEEFRQKEQVRILEEGLKQEEFKKYIEDQKDD